MIKFVINCVAHVHKEVYNSLIESVNKQVNKMNLEQLLQENEMLKKRIREIADDARCYAGCSHEGTLQGGLLEIHEDLLKLINGE